MSFSFKNTELFRYFISESVTDNVDRIIEQNNSQYSMIVGSVFSGSFSILGTLLSILFTPDSKDPLSTKDIVLKALFYVCVFILLFGIGLVIYKILRFCWIYLKNKFWKEKKLSEADFKKRKNDFDHIVCDNMLISFKFIEQCTDTEDEELKTFYFFEVIYYLKIAILKTNKLFEIPSKCINTPNTSENIDMYRIVNVLDMMDSIYGYIKKNYDGIKYHNEYQKMIEIQIGKLESDIKIIKDKYQEFYKANF